MEQPLRKLILEVIRRLGVHITDNVEPKLVGLRSGWRSI